MVETLIDRDVAEIISWTSCDSFTKDSKPSNMELAWGQTVSVKFIQINAPLATPVSYPPNASESDLESKRSINSPLTYLMMNVTLG